MLSITRSICLALCLVNAALAEEAPVAVETLAPHIKPGHPDEFALSYRLREQDISPDKGLGVIYADSTAIDPDRARNYLVALKPFRILAPNHGFAYFDPGNHRQMAVQWAKDSSAALVMVGDKWGTIGATLFELREGRVTRRTDMMLAITKLLTARFPQGKARPYNDTLLFVLDREEKFELTEDGRQIHLDVSATNNPNLSPKKTWVGTLKAVWSIPAARWLERKTTGQLSAAKPE